MSMPLFVFGSLRDSEVLEVVLGRVATDIRTNIARLQGYRAVKLPDESYPVLLVAPGSTVEGELLLGLSAEDFRRIAFFENQEYRFEPCTVTLEGGGRRNAVYCGENQTQAGACEPWLLDTWQRVHKCAFLEHTRQFMQFYGTAGPEAADEIWRELKKQAG